jgi:predicted metal-dependent hydrolase
MMLDWLAQQINRMAKQSGHQAGSVALRQPGPPGNTVAAEIQTRQIMLGAQSITYRLRRSRRRSIGFLISADGLQVTAPQHVTIGSIEQALQEKQDWITQKLLEMQSVVITPKVAWGDGMPFPFLGQNVTLRLNVQAPRHGEFDPHSATLSLRPGAKPGDQVRRWMQARAEGLFAQRLALYATRLGVQFSSFGLSSARTRWGSCSAGGKIRLNWRLMHFDLRLIDYVVAHELAHLREMNHSPRFWQTVASIYPDYAAARAELKQQAAALRHFF